LALIWVFFRVYKLYKFLQERSVGVSVRVRDLARLSQSEFRILAFRHEVRKWVLASVSRVQKDARERLGSKAKLVNHERRQRAWVCVSVSDQKMILIGLITVKLLTLPLCVSDKEFNILESQKWSIFN